MDLPWQRWGCGGKRMNTQSTYSRVPWIDIAKGYGTLLVIYAHLGVGTIHSWMYSFHLPLFFFLSGYVFSTKYNFKDFLFRKIKSIVIPYFCLGIPIYLFREFYFIISDQFSFEDAMQHLQQFILQQRLWTLWFIACLFCLNIIFYLLIKFCRKEWQIALISVLLACLGLLYYHLGGSPLYWNFDVCFTAMPFFAVGYLYKLHTNIVDQLIMPKRLPLFLLFGIINLISWRLSLDETGLGLEMFASNYGNPIFTYIAAYTGIFCVIIASKWITIEPIRYIGENSMIYYAWHQGIMIPIISKTFAFIGFDNLMTYGLLGSITYRFVCTIIIIIALTFCNWCIVKLGLKFMVGK